MKVLLLSRYSRIGASSRIRYYQYLPYLREHNVEVSVASLFDDDYVIKRHAGHLPDPPRIIGAYLRRLLRLLSAGSFDLLWIEYELLPWLPAWGEALLARCGIPYIAEYDDAIFDRYEQYPSALVRRLLGDKIDRVMRNAALVIVGNDYLRDRARAVGVRAVSVLPSVVDLERYDVAPRRPGQAFTVGWIGSPMTAGYLRLVAPALARMHTEGGCRIVLVGAEGLDQIFLEKVPPTRLPAEVRPWSEDTEVEEIQTFDVGINPVLDRPWEHGKCGYKIIQYMACGKPVVASPVGVSAEIVRHGENGFLAETEEDWIRGLLALRDDPALRERMGQAGRRLVTERYNLQVTAPKLLALLRQTAESPRRTATQIRLRPKTLHVITGLQIGGAESMLTNMILARRPDSEPPVVVSLIPGGENETRLKQAGLPVSSLGMRRGRLAFRGPFRLAAMIRRYKPDVIQSWMYHSDLIATIAWLLSGRARRSRLIWGIRCSDMETRSYGRSLGLVIRACALLSRLPDAVIANSEAGVRVHRRLGYRPRRFLVVDNGIDVRRFAPDAKARREVREQLGVPSSEVLLALVARVDPMKDHATFLKAFRRVRGAGALLVGRGTKSLPEVPGLYRLGQRGDVPRLLAACDIVVCSSAFGEGFSNAIAEGMAAGLAPIATEVGDARRIIGEAGLVVPPRDPEALAQAIRRLVDNEAERRELGRRARRRIVERFSLERASRAFAQVHREAWSRSSRQQA